MTALLGLLWKAAPLFIGLIDKLRGGGNGKEKFSEVLQLLIALAQIFVTNGKIAKDTVINDKEIGGMLESVVQLLNSRKVLNGTDTDLVAVLNTINGTTAAPKSTVIITGGTVSVV